MSVHHARKNMKDKNRFSVLLKHLTSMANLKKLCARQISAVRRVLYQ